MRAIALFSGGKDSTYALYLAMQQGHSVERLITIVPKNEDSYMYHVPVIDRTRYQAKAMGIPQDVYSAGDDAEELMDILSKYDTDMVISGAIASNYQKTRIEEVCTDLGVVSYTPLWLKNQRTLLEDMLLAGFEIMMVGVAAYGLDDSFLGRVIDDEILKKLDELERKYRINIAGEGGEYETYVLYAPMFSKRIVVEDYDKIWDGVRGHIIMKSVSLEVP